MEIPEIGVRNLDIPPIRTFDWLNNPPQAIPIYPPVTTQVGVPIINIPGCVEAHEADDGKNKNLTEDDPKGTRVYCDASTPSFNPLDYSPEGLTLSGPPVEPPKFENQKPELNVPETKIPKTEIPKCPTRAQELKNPIGKILEGNKKIVAYELVGKECIEVTEKLNLQQQIVENIPSAGLVVTTGSIAAVAATSALLAKPLADLLLKVVKPAVKKTVQKIGIAFGRVPKLQSLRDRQDHQRMRTRALRELRKMKKR
tara:strand:- start:17172 stop:17939 length:768 start_codon:yes stop_codon:yes gene_type:complete